MTTPHIHQVVISAPFGNYIHYPKATSTIGTFTLHHRGGMLKRLWRCARTLRPLWKAGGYINKLGLPNPGVESLKGHYTKLNPRPFDDKIVSVHGFNQQEWRDLAYIMVYHRTPTVELNLSCPNVGHTHYLKDIFMKEIEECVSILLRNNVHVIAKLPPVKWLVMANPLWDMGVRAFHCCNTIPTPLGGVSGSAVKNYSMWAVEETKDKWGSAARVIGGGGVHGEQDVNDYIRAGADHVAVGSAFLTANPWKWKRLGAICRNGYSRPDWDKWYNAANKPAVNSMADELDSIANEAGRKSQSPPSELGFFFSKGENDAK